MQVTPVNTNFPNFQRKKLFLNFLRSPGVRIIVLTRFYFICQKHAYVLSEKGLTTDILARDCWNENILIIVSL